MPEQNAAGVATNDGLTEQLGTYKSLLAGTVSSGRIRLYASTLQPTKATSLASYTAAECTFGGYALVTPTWNAVDVDQAGNPGFSSSRAYFSCTTLPVMPGTLTVGGAWLDDGAKVEEFVPFNPPIPIAAVGNFVGVSLRITGIPGPSTADVDS